MNVTATSLEEKFKGEGIARFTEIARLGGFGEVGGGENFIPVTHTGGLDLTGVLDPENKAIDPADKAKIKELAGLTTPAKAESSDKKDGK